MVDEEDFDYIMTFEEIKQIFEEAKKTPRNDEGCLPEKLEIKVGRAIADAGREDYYQFTDDIWAYLDYPWDHLQEEAIKSLGYPHKIFDRGFRDEAYKIWHDENRTDLTRGIAFGIWYGYYDNTKDAAVLADLYRVLTQSSSYFMRVKAQLGILDVCGIKISYQQSMAISDLDEKDSHEYINEHTDWDRIHQLMRQYAPDVKLVDVKTLTIPNP
ncbi:hypothetical protein [Candidatus Odyssella thessalonicensis]|uniref:hypothetical protein n=1 Tax=Candidatus Odyssella thessalonicensis TaxID=84647 RepID=UPI000225BFC0|nr:hypothetical protein [Candidatus Odyssella thessalonicensis]